MKKLSDEDYRVMGLPQRFHDVNWEWMKTHGVADHFEKYLKNLHLAKQQGVGLFIGGVPLSGKSYSAAVVAKAFRQNLYSVQWLDAIEGYSLVNWNRDFNDSEYGTWLSRVHFVDVLIVDNFGAEKASNRTKVMYEIVKKRFEAKLPTIITTRQNLAQLRETYENESMDFLRECMKSIILTSKIDSKFNKMIEENF